MMTKKLSDSEMCAYQQWEKSAATKTGIRRYLDYLPTDPVFTVRNEDVPVPGGKELAGDKQRIVSAESAQSHTAGHAVLSSRFGSDQIRSVLSMVDGQRCVGEITRSLSSTYEEQDVIDLLNRLVGHAVFLPDTVRDLGAAIAPHEIVRIPVISPYTLLREYWENQAAIRQHLSEMPNTLDTRDAFRGYLSELHVIATVGLSGRSYYGGGGGTETAPGVYRTSAIVTTVLDNMVEFISRELTGIGHNYPIRADKTLRSDRDRVVAYSLDSARTHHHHYDGPDDIEEKVDELREALLAVEECLLARDVIKGTMALSYFHWLFSQVHPFANINNSIAMNIVNSYLRAMGVGYLSHLFLDYIAQRTNSKIYESIFQRYVEKFAGSGSDHTRKVRMMRHYYFRFANTPVHHQDTGSADSAQHP